MTIAYDPDFESALAAMHAAYPHGFPVTPRMDWQALRTSTEQAFEETRRAASMPSDIRWTDHQRTTSDGRALNLRWIQKEGGQPGSALVYIHGGGMICCTVEHYMLVLAGLVHDSGVPILAVDFLNAPENRAEHLAEDALTGVSWLLEHSPELGIDASRIAIGGDSGGGGIAAGATILARDRGIPIAKQILICPMLDDRTVEPDPVLAPLATWTYDNNITAWTAILGDRRGTDTVPASVAPARLTDFRNLPPAFIDTGEVDIFRDEDITYAQNLLRAGVHVDFFLNPGAPHGFEGLTPSSPLAKTVWAQRIKAIRSI
ncbi:alpha/beta hydrolase fold domain-containing protein [Arthrobacter burdickii]|uniref:Alpha/beta hydrolase fold domain-containing protein n=1 Tax=Arthrobacter burdickii TaxID=3035920 RepID=A0ABT8JYG6_9MICC|nr:alpha/beta hydrolase fold domain-containing protein [Arthrobacter burdickii]MDN4609892.1 alpha/beta hydrolase fold domain-containing protein [Arthrobacter burdickii]